MKIIGDIEGVIERNKNGSFSIFIKKPYESSRIYDTYEECIEFIENEKLFMGNIISYKIIK